MMMDLTRKIVDGIVLFVLSLAAIIMLLAVQNKKNKADEKPNKMD